MQSGIYIICCALIINGVACLQCGTNEEKSDSCERTCETALQKDRICTTHTFKPACICKLGYGRHNGECVPSTGCPPNTAFKCSTGEIFHKCGKSCDRACGRPAAAAACPSACSTPAHACVCISGYARKNGDCVKVEKC